MMIDAAYENLARGVPVPFEWAAKYGDVWTLHYSLLVGMDIPNDGNEADIAEIYKMLKDYNLSNREKLKI